MSNMPHIIKEDYLTVHKALHNPAADKVKVNFADNPLYMIELSIKVGLNGCRYVDYKDAELGDTQIMEQNPNTKSGYAARAKKGEHLSWVFQTKLGPDGKFYKRYAGTWILIEDTTQVTNKT